jgi:hypothetical protein
MNKSSIFITIDNIQTLNPVIITKAPHRVKMMRYQMKSKNLALLKIVLSIQPTKNSTELIKYRLAQTKNYFMNAPDQKATTQTI